MKITLLSSSKLLSAETRRSTVASKIKTYTLTDSFSKLVTLGLKTETSGSQALSQHAQTDLCFSKSGATLCSLLLTLKLQLSNGGKNEPTPLFQLDIPAKLQVGAHSAAVYTTKIRLAQARVSKRQSQPFKVRVEINIAGSRAGGSSGVDRATHL